MSKKSIDDFKLSENETTDKFMKEVFKALDEVYNQLSEQNKGEGENK